MKICEIRGKHIEYLILSIHSCKIKLLNNYSISPTIFIFASYRINYRTQNIKMIQVTDKAKNKILELRSKEGLADQATVRVSVKGGGCSGLMYDLNFDETRGEKDQVFEDKGVKILVDKKSMLYLVGTTLDFSDGLNGKGFQFINPNASRTCGCGESFAV